MGYYRFYGKGDYTRFFVYDLANQNYPPGLAISFNTDQLSWTKFSVWGTATYETLNVFPFGSSDTYVSGMYADYDGIMAINLTDVFGVGNEPSKKWCDENLDYFDGTKTLHLNK